MCTCVILLIQGSEDRSFACRPLKLYDDASIRGCTPTDGCAEFGYTMQSEDIVILGGSFNENAALRPSDAFEA